MQRYTPAGTTNNVRSNQSTPIPIEQILKYCHQQHGCLSRTQKGAKCSNRANSKNPMSIWCHIGAHESQALFFVAGGGVITPFGAEADNLLADWARNNRNNVSDDDSFSIQQPVWASYMQDQNPTTMNNVNTQMNNVNRRMNNLNLEENRRVSTEQNDYMDRSLINDPPQQCQKKYNETQRPIYQPSGTYGKKPPLESLHQSVHNRHPQPAPIQQTRPQTPVSLQCQYTSSQIDDMLAAYLEILKETNEHTQPQLPPSPAPVQQTQHPMPVSLQSQESQTDTRGMHLYIQQMNETNQKLVALSTQLLESRNAQYHNQSPQYEDPNALLEEEQIEPQKEEQTTPLEKPDILQPTKEAPTNSATKTTNTKTNTVTNNKTKVKPKKKKVQQPDPVEPDLEAVQDET